MTTLLALSLSVSDAVRTVGAIAGLVAIPGLAVLSILYFGQARELKRLREWAGRGPEKAAELSQQAAAESEKRVVAQPQRAPGQPATVAGARANGDGPAPPAPAPVGAPAATSPSVPAAPAPQPSAPGASVPPARSPVPADKPGAPEEREATPSPAVAASTPPVAAPRAPAEASPAQPDAPANGQSKDQPAPAIAAAASSAAASKAAAEPATSVRSPTSPATAAGAAGGGGAPVSPAPPIPPRPPQAVRRVGTGSTTGSVALPRPDESRSRRSLLVPGLAVLALVVAGAVVATVLTTGGGSGTGTHATASRASASTPAVAGRPPGGSSLHAIRAGTDVVVLNGTAVPFLAARYGRRLHAPYGYHVIDTRNAPDTRTLTQVGYTPNHQRAARDIAHLLHLGRDAVVPIDAGTQLRAGPTAVVVVTVGQDLAR